MIRRYLIRAFAIVLIAAALDVFLQQALIERHQSEQRADLALRVGEIRARLEAEITASLLQVEGTANFISVTPDLDQQTFETYAREVLRGKSLLRNVGAAPDFIMRYVYPRAGNEAVLGMNYRRMPGQWEQARKVRETGHMVVAGPLKLVQGGTGLVGRAPVYVRTTGGEPRFWGIVSAVMDVEALFENVGLHDMVDPEVALRGVDGKGEDGAVFFGPEELFSAQAQPVRAEVMFPTGSWVLAARPAGGWATTHPLALQVHLLVGGFLAAVLVFTWRELRERQALEEARRAQRAMTDASYDAFIMIDPDDTIHYWSTAAKRMFGWSRKEALGAKLHSLIVPEEYRALAAEGLKRFARTGRGAVLDSVEEFWALRKDGSMIPVERTVTAFERGGRFFAVSNLRDITRRKAAEEELRAFAERIALASEAGGIGIWEWNVRTGELVWDRRMYEIYGVAEDEFEAMYDAWASRVHPEDIARAEAELAQAVSTGSEWKWEFRIVLPSGEQRHIQAVARAHREEDGTPTRVIGVNHDVTEARVHERELERLATTDGLTGLFNRRHFMELAADELERSRRYGHPLSLVMLDADRFKAVNDNHGHDVGDQVLRKLAKVALGVAREVDAVGRVGGEEFAVLLPETGLDAAASMAERLREAVEATSVPLPGGAQLTWTISLGVACAEAGDAGAQDLVKRADQALYRAKESGRNRVETA